MGFKCNLHGLIGVRIKEREDVANLIVGLISLALKLYGPEFTKFDLDKAERELTELEAST